MKIHYDLAQLPHFHNAVITIGSYDGVHRGHKVIFQKAKRIASQINGETVIVTFSPHPRTIIFPKDDSLRLLSTQEEQIQELEKLGIDHLVIVPFSIEFSQQLPREYIETFLVNTFSPSHIVIGYDHQFGRNRAGNTYLLEQYADTYGFKVTEIPKQEYAGSVLSSTKIRNAINEKDIQRANLLLGHYYPIRGKVVHGIKLGNQLGFPTANIEIAHPLKLIPPGGIYAAFAEVRGEIYEGMLYIGTRPTITKEGSQSIEIHLFHFEEQIYDEYITIRVVQFLREDEQFNTLEELRHQLRIDQFHTEECLAKENIRGFLYQEREEIAVVILNYNGESFLRQYLPSLLEYTDLHQVDIWVVDNASVEDDIPALQEEFPDIHFLSLDQNYGFAEGYNKALQEIQADWFVLLNNDIQVSPNWLPPLLEVLFSSEDIMVVQPKIRSAREPALFEYAGAAGGQIDNLGYPFCRGRVFDTVEQDDGQYDEVQSIFWASGAAMLIKADLFLRSGGFDKDFFAHQEEIDLCWRIRRAGYDIKYVPQSTVFHYGGGTLDYSEPRKVYLNFKNNLVTLIKNEPMSRLWWLFPLRLLLDGIAGIKFLLEGKYPSFRHIIKAHWTIFGSWHSIWRKRKESKDRIVYIRQHKDTSSTVSQVRYKGSIVYQYFIRKRKYVSKFI